MSYYCYSKILETQQPIPNLLVPVPAENQAMLEAWLNRISNHDSHWKILNYDPVHEVFWLEATLPYDGTLPSYALQLGHAVYYALKEMQEQKRTKWQFPCLRVDRKPITEQPLPPQYLYEWIEIHFPFWSERMNMQAFLDEFNQYYYNYDVDGQNTFLTVCGYHDMDTGYGGTELVCEVENMRLPISAGILFEMGVQLAHADATNFWNLPPALPQPQGYSNNAQDIKRELNVYLSLPENYFERDKKILFLKKLLIQQTITDKIAALRDLSQSRHLLIREKIELSFLEKIQSADSLAALQSIENELNNTATDVDLIQKLLKYVREKQAFY